MSGQITIRLLEEADRDAETGWDEGDLVFVPGTGLTSYNGTSWAPVGAGVDATTLVGWTQDGGTGLVDTGSQDFTANVITASTVNAAISTLGEGIDTGGGDVSLTGDPFVGRLIFDSSNELSFDGTNVLVNTALPLLVGAGLDAQEYPITNFSTIEPHTKPEVAATPTAQDIVDALVTLGLITQAAP